MKNPECGSGTFIGNGNVWRCIVGIVNRVKMKIRFMEAKILIWPEIGCVIWIMNSTRIRTKVVTEVKTVKHVLKSSVIEGEWLGVHLTA